MFQYLWISQEKSVTHDKVIKKYFQYLTSQLFQWKVQEWPVRNVRGTFKLPFKLI